MEFSMNHNPVSEIYRDKGHGPLTFGFDIGMAVESHPELTH
jgi:hypothetical protein